jgi:hypothetical protein
MSEDECLLEDAERSLRETEKLRNSETRGYACGQKTPKLHTKLHTHRAFDAAQLELNEKAPTCASTHPAPEGFAERAVRCSPM